MKLKRLFAAVLAAVSMLTMGMMLSGCGGSGDSKEDAASASYTTQDEAVQAATKESQEVVKQIEAREGKVVVNRLRASDEAGAEPGHNRVVGQLFDGVHGIISADVNKRLNIQFLQDRKDLVVNRPVFVDLREFVPA